MHDAGRDAPAIAVLRWTMVLIFLWFGGMKFATYEAEGVATLARNYWATGWLYPLVGVAGASAVIGIIEIATGLLLAAGQRIALASLVGGAMGIITFLMTLSFMLIAPMVWQDGYGFPALGGTGQFLIKDIVLLAACLLLARDGLNRYRVKDEAHA